MYPCWVHEGDKWRALTEWEPANGWIHHVFLFGYPLRSPFTPRPFRGNLWLFHKNAETYICCAATITARKNNKDKFRTLNKKWSRKKKWSAITGTSESHGFVILLYKLGRSGKLFTASRVCNFINVSTFEFITAIIRRVGTLTTLNVRRAYIYLCIRTLVLCIREVLTHFRKTCAYVSFDEVHAVASTRR